MSDEGKSLLTPAPDFGAPLDLLHACHGRIETQCATLLKLPGHIQVHGADTQARQAATAIVRYFSSAGQHHHEDEEQDLFPLVREHAATNGDDQMLALLDNLSVQHRDMEAAWQALLPWLEPLSRGEPSMCDAAGIARFTALYRAHIALEEQTLLPYGRKALQADQLAELGRRMALRRGIIWPKD